MLQKIMKFVENNKMFQKGDRVVIGVSGGADSVCLFFVLLELKKVYGLNLYVIHINHGLRGREADEDEAYVKEICEKSKVIFQSIHVDVAGLVQEQGISEEEAGRNLRYEAFYQVCNSIPCHKIAIAHNENDQAETVLFHLFRGSGIKGLTGIAPVRGQIVRPLLCVNRKEIEHYLSTRGFHYQIDRTNLTEQYARNKIRNRVLPYVLKEINKKAVEHVVQAASILSETEKYIEKNVIFAFEQIVSEHNGQYSFLVDAFFQEDIVIQKRIIRKIIEKLIYKLKNIEADHVSLILSLKEKQVGKRLDLPYGICAIREYERIRLYVKAEIDPVDEENIEKNIEITFPGTYNIPWTGLDISFEMTNMKKNSIIPKNDCTKWFDYDKIINALFVRNRHKGDFIQIDAKGNNKMIKAYFIDKKVPKEERNQIPLLADGNHIIWVIGGRISEAYKVSEETERILVVKIVGGTQDGR